MERIESRLFEAAIKGNVNLLQKTVEEDPLILDRVTVNYLSETPLHVASMLGHLEFVKEIIRKKPQLATEVNILKATPLHLASAKGHVQVVRELMSVNSDETLLMRDRNGLMPIHLAAIKGQVDVMKEFVCKKPYDHARATVYRGESVLHLCIRHYQLEILKLLVKTITDPGFINSRDDDGNTILHVAVAHKQVEIIKFLMTMNIIEVNALNLNGMTAMDILLQSQGDIRDLEIEEYIKRAGGFRTMEPNTTPLPMITQSSASSQYPHYLISSSSHIKDPKTWGKLLKQQDEWLERKKDTLMIVASLIATMAFQIGVNPPGGVWQDDELVDSQGNPVSDPHYAGRSILASNHSIEYSGYYIVNTVGFIASLSIILLLISGLPIRRKFFMWILMVIIWIAITAIALIYMVSVLHLTPPEQDNSMAYVIGFTVLTWIGIMALLLIGHTIRLVLKLIKKLYRMCKPRRYSMFNINP